MVVQKKKTTTYNIVNPSPEFGQGQKCGGLNPLIEYQPSPLEKCGGLNSLIEYQPSSLEKWISSDNTYKNKR